MSSGTAGANPDQTNMYKADGGIWLILFWMDDTAKHRLAA